MANERAQIPANPVNLMSEWLADRKWIFFERGMMRYWNELALLFSVTIAGTPTTATIGASDMVTSFAPDFIAIGGLNGQYNLSGVAVSPPTQSR